MASVYIPAPLRDLCAGASRLELTASTLDQLLRALDERCPGFYARIVEDGAIRPELAVAIDGEAANYPLGERLHAAADVTIVPAISGGASPAATR